MKKQRLDKILADRGLVESRERGRRLVMAGEVRVNGQTVFKPATPVSVDTDVEVVAPPRYVSRGGEKLAAALAAWDVPVDGAVCADIGASTGGFTDCLLQAGARRVYAVDVGRGLLHWKLRNDPRVVVMESTNARHLETLPERVRVVSIDAAFISLALLLPNARAWLGDGPGEVVALVKPQFEAGPRNVGKGGVVRDPVVHSRVVRAVIAAASSVGLASVGLLRSPVLGRAGNVEFLLRLVLGGGGVETGDLLAGAGLSI